ncbi:unnamed protein product, partial [Discosporangium mesarthrocarpum]
TGFVPEEQSTGMEETSYVLSYDTASTMSSSYGTDDSQVGNGQADAGEDITFEFLITNTGMVPVSEVAIVENQSEMDVACPQSGLEVSMSMVCIGAYMLTQEDIDAGLVYNKAMVYGQGPEQDDGSRNSTQ